MPKNFLIFKKKRKLSPKKKSISRHTKKVAKQSKPRSKNFVLLRGKPRRRASTLRGRLKKPLIKIAEPKILTPHLFRQSGLHVPLSLRRSRLTASGVVRSKLRAGKGAGLTKEVKLKAFQPRKKPTFKKVIKKETPIIEKVQKKISKSSKRTKVLRSKIQRGKKVVFPRQVRKKLEPKLLKPEVKQKGASPGEKVLPAEKVVKKPKRWTRLKKIVRPAKPELLPKIIPSISKIEFKTEEIAPTLKPSEKPKAISKKLKKPSETAKMPKFEVKAPKIRIKVIGIGGGGSAIVNELVSKMKEVDFIVANTDIQALKMAKKDAKKFLFGHSVTHGLGAGMNPKFGEAAAKKDSEKIKKLFENTNLCFLVSCLGGGTGSGASPVFAEIAKNLRVLIIGIFTLPFNFEGKIKREIAKESLEKLKENINAFAVIPNENVSQIIDKKTPFREALGMINKNIYQTLQEVLEMISLPGLINVDFADLKTVLEERGQLIYLQSKEAEGENRAEEAVKEALLNPLYDYNAEGATGLLFNIAGGKNLKMQEVEQIGRNLTQSIGPQAKVIFGIRQEEKYKAKIKVTLVACGCQKEGWGSAEVVKDTEKPGRETELFEKLRAKKEAEGMATEKAREAEEAQFEIPPFLRKK